MTKTSRNKMTTNTMTDQPVNITEKKGAEITSAIKMNEKQDEYVVYVAVPGMERKDFSLTIEENMLTVAAIKKEAVHCFTLLDEQSFPEWKETFILPEDADTVMTAAVYRNGELEIHIPKGKNHMEGKAVDVFIY